MSADDYMNEKVLKLGKPFEETVARRLEDSPEPTERTERTEQTEMQQVREQLAEMRAMVTEAREESMLAREVQDSSPGDGEMWDLMPMGGDGGGGGLDGFQIYTATHAVFYVSMDDAMDGYDPTAAGAGHTNWSLEFLVASSKLSNKSTTAPLNPVGTHEMGTGSGAASTERYNGDAGADPVVAQTYYRIPIIRGGKWVCRGGAYRENHHVMGSRGPIVELIRI